MCRILRKISSKNNLVFAFDRIFNIESNTCLTSVYELTDLLGLLYFC